MVTYEHDVVVVGGGMFGSACARHLATLARDQGQQLNIAIIGAEEPGDRADTEVSKLVPQKVPSEANPKVRNHGEGPY